MTKRTNKRKRVVRKPQVYRATLNNGETWDMAIVAAVIRQAIKDADATAMRWLGGANCAWYCDMVGLDFGYLQRRIKGVRKWN